MSSTSRLSWSQTIYGRLDLDFLLRSALLLFSFEFSFSCHLFTVVTILIESFEFGQLFNLVPREQYFKNRVFAVFLPLFRLTLAAKRCAENQVGQLLLLPTDLPFLSPKTLDKPNKHNLHEFIITLKPTPIHKVLFKVKFPNLVVFLVVLTVRGNYDKYIESGNTRPFLSNHHTFNR